MLVIGRAVVVLLSVRSGLRVKVAFLFFSPFGSASDGKVSAEALVPVAKYISVLAAPGSFAFPRALVRVIMGRHSLGCAAPRVLATALADDC